MNDLSIRITHRAQQDCNPAETTIEIGNTAANEPTLFDQGPIDVLRRPDTPQLEWSPTLCDGKRVDYATAEKACAALGEGWRLPTRPELESILDLARHNPAIDTEEFPDTKSDWYWTSTPCAWSSGRAWCVGFGSGGVGNGHRDYDLAFARAVRSVPAGQ